MTAVATGKRIAKAKKGSGSFPTVGPGKGPRPAASCGLLTESRAGPSHSGRLITACGGGGGVGAELKDAPDAGGRACVTGAVYLFEASGGRGKCWNKSQLKLQPPSRPRFYRDCFNELQLFHFDVQYHHRSSATYLASQIEWELHVRSYTCKRKGYSRKRRNFVGIIGGKKRLEIVCISYKISFEHWCIHFDGVHFASVPFCNFPRVLSSLKHRLN